MDLELSDEQTWLSESVETLLTRAWAPAADAPGGSEAERRRLWTSLVDFGALTVGGEGGLGAVELCLIARALGSHLAPAPYLGSAAVRFALAGASFELGDDAVALALLEPGSGWSLGAPRTTLKAGPGGEVVGAAHGGLVLTGRKSGVEHAGSVARLAVVATGPYGPVLALAAGDGAGITVSPQPALDATAPIYAVDFADAPAARLAAGDAIRRLTTVGALLAAAEAVGAAGRLLEDACRYAAERRQFGRPIGSFQALRHLMADMYVRQASSWSSVLYAAATLDEDADEAARTASIAKAYVSRAAREVAHGAMQVFGGIAVTAEHPAHRFLRRIIVREQQFGDAAHHERALGQALAAAAVPEPVS